MWPKSNVEFWKNKIESNVARDKRNYAILKNEGWNVLVVWECEIKSNVEETMKRTISLIKTSRIDSK